MHTSQDEELHSHYQRHPGYWGHEKQAPMPQSCAHAYKPDEELSSSIWTTSKDLITHKKTSKDILAATQRGVLPTYLLVLKWNISIEAAQGLYNIKQSKFACQVQSRVASLGGERIIPVTPLPMKWIVQLGHIVFRIHELNNHYLIDHIETSSPTVEQSSNSLIISSEHSQMKRSVAILWLKQEET